MTDTTPTPPHDAEARLAALQALLRAVAARPGVHDFFSLLRRVDALRPEAPRTGHARLPAQEALRFGQPPELNFAPAALSELDLSYPPAPRMRQRFFGLLGPHGPMPLHFTEFVRERLRKHDDPGVADFLDMFHHRLVSLFYRAWAQAQPVVQADRPLDDHFLAWLLAAAGQQPGLHALPARTLAFNAGLLAGRTRHPEALCKVLRQQFGVAARIEPHIGQWMPIVREDQSRLGYARNRPERAQAPRAELGRLQRAHGSDKLREFAFQAYAGNKVWDMQHRFRLHLGPMSWAQYQRLLPDGPDWPALQAWVRHLAGASLRWDVELSLTPEARPKPLLAGRRRGEPDAPGTRPATPPGGRAGTPLGARLGISTWLGQQHPPALRQLRLRPATTVLRAAPVPKR